MHACVRACGFCACGRLSALVHDACFLCACAFVGVCVCVYGWGFLSRVHAICMFKAAGECACRLHLAAVYGGLEGGFVMCSMLAALGDFLFPVPLRTGKLSEGG